MGNEFFKAIVNGGWIMAVGYFGQCLATATIEAVRYVFKEVEYDKGEENVDKKEE